MAISDVTSFDRLAFERDCWGQLIMVLADGTRCVGVEPIRCFPLTDPENSIAIIDSEGHELLNLPSLGVLSPAAQEILRRELADREFVPTIQRILSTSTPNPPCRWEVETDRGRTAFQLESEDDCRRLGANGALIADSNGVRYSISNIDSLDAASQRIVRRLV